MNILHSIVLKISSVFTALLVVVGLSSAPVEIPVEPTPAPIEIVEVEPAPEVIENITPAQIVVEQKTTSLSNNTALEIVSTPETPTVIIQLEEKKPEKKDNIFKEQEDLAMGTIEKKYSITPQEGSPLKPRKDISLEQLREYVIQMNYQVVAFRQKMAEASEGELIEYLNHNGFVVETNE